MGYLGPMDRETPEKFNETPRKREANTGFMAQI